MITTDDLVQLEPALENLVREHGFEKLNDAIFELLGERLNWPDCQRVSNLAIRIQKRINREEPTRPQTGKKK